MNKVLKKVLGYSAWTVASVVIVLVLFLGSLFFREQKLPRFIIDRITSGFSTSEFAVDCDGASFGFRHGIRLSGLSLYDLRRPDSLERPVARARTIHLNMMRSKMFIYGLEYAKLPDSYYTPSPAAVKTLPPPVPVEFEIPDMDDMTVVLESPSILGLNPDRVSAKVRTFPGKGLVMLEDLEVVLPGKDSDTVLRGNVAIDLPRQKISTKFGGTATQRQIRPFLEVMDIRCSLPYMDAFTDIKGVVKADAEIDVDLCSHDFSLLLDLDVPEMGRYNSVPMVYARGGIYFHSRVVDGERRVALKVSIPSAADGDGGILSGWLTVDDFSGVFRINYDVKSGLRLADSLKIADFMDPSTLDFIEFGPSSLVTVKGITGTSAADLAVNDLEGTAMVPSGSLSGFRFVDLKGVYSLKGDVFGVNAEMSGTSGGKLKFTTSVFCEKFEEGDAHFALSGTYRDGSLKELSEVLAFDLGERKGDIDIDLDIRGDLSSNMWSTVNGRGSVKITDGHLARMKLFAGLTELLAERVPGVSFLVDQTQASSDFEFKDGVFVSENVYIEGGLISIKGWGSYDIVKDNLDFTARVQFMKKESIAGKIIHPLTYPFTKLLLEFKLTGQIDDPNWEYIQILDRIF